MTPTTQRGPTAERPRDAPGEVAAIDDQRRRFMRVGLVGAAAAATLAAFDPAASPGVLAWRAGVLLACVGGLLALRRKRELSGLARALTVFFTAAVLGLALARLPQGWPLALADLVPVLVYSMLLVGPRLAVALAGASVAVLLGALLVLGPAGPPHLGPQLYGLLGSLVLTTWYFRRFAMAVSAGAADLATSVHGLETLRRDSAGLSMALSEQVAQAVGALARSVGRGLDEVKAAAEAALRAMEDSKRRIPAEPELPELSLEERLRELRHHAMDVSIVVLLAFDALGLARMAWQGPRENLPVGAAGLAAVLVAAALRWRRPAWRRPVTLAMWISAYAASVPLAWGWYARAPVVPPPLTPQLTIALFMGALYGPRLAWACLGVSLGVSFAALALHPGIAPAGVLGVVTLYALATWGAWQWPRALLEALRQQREAAASAIRERRRLVATLFHDLANPMMVVSAALDLEARGHHDPGLPALLGEMVARMQASLAAALSGRVDVQAIEAGQLCDDVEHLFRERLARKHVALEIAGPREARVRGDVALLRDSVLANLVSNALKFSPEGGTIDVTVRPEDGAVALLVEDRGPGLPAEVARSLELGSRVPSRPGSAGEGGSGYGLMLARDYVSAMGGKLELTPRPGGGLTARVRLPPA